MRLVSRNSCSSLQKPHLLSLQYHLAPLVSFYRSVTSSSRDTKLLCMPQETNCDDRFGDKSIPSHRHDIQTTARGIRHMVRRLTRRQSTAATNICKRFVRNQKSLGHTHPTSSLSQSHCPISLHIQTFAMFLFYEPVYQNTDSFSVHEHCRLFLRSRHVFHKFGHTTCE